MVTEATEKQSPYQKLCSNDIVHYLSEYLNTRSYELQEDGKIKVKLFFPHETPWIHINSSTEYDCETAKQILFGAVRKKLGIDFVPAKCQECWKTVVRPQTVKQLFQLLAVMQRLNLDSKCGIEIRDSVDANYGGYFYNHSLKEGLETWKQIRAEVDEHIDPDVKVFLKRGCTEFEHACGDSLKWTVPEWQAKLEQMIDNALIKYDIAHQQSPIVQKHVMRRWIEFAHSRADYSYLDYTDGQRIYPRYRTYQHLAYATDDEIAAFMASGGE